MAEPFNPAQSPQYCPSCGAQRGDGPFCSACGARLSAPAEASDESDWVRLVADGSAPGATAAPQAFPVAVRPTLNPSAATAPMAEPAVEPAPARRGIAGWMVGVGIIALLAVGGVAWRMASDLPGRASLEPESDVTAGTGAAAQVEGPDAWKSSYVDRFVSGPQAVIVRTNAEQRDFPAAEGTMIVGTLDQGAEVNGRWVLGHDGRRWLMLAPGRYVVETALAEPGSPDAPIAIPFSNRSSDFGPEIEAQFRRLNDVIARRNAQIEALPEDKR